MKSNRNTMMEAPLQKATPPLPVQPEHKAEQEDSGYIDWLRHEEECALAKLIQKNT